MALFKQLRAREQWSLDRLHQFQLEKLNRLLTHAYHQVPYYKNNLPSHLPISDNQVDIKSLDQFYRLPLLSKATVKKEGERMHALDISTRKSFANASGGSTGEPTRVQQDEVYLIAEEAGLVQIKNWRGVDPYDSEIFIWGSPRDTFENGKPLSARLGDFVRNRIMLNCFNMTPSDMERYIRLLNRHRPAMIRAYVDAIYELACYAKRNNLKVVPQKAIHTGAGNLFEYMRHEIEEVFACPVYNHYGGREVGHIASECRNHNGLHIFMEHNLVEILDENDQPVPDGVEGEIVVTNLNNFSMPLIRYRIGDRGIMMPYQDCSCGCGYPKLKEITGRVGDVFRTADGQAVSPGFFAHLIGVVADQKGIKKYQAVQHTPKSLTLRIVLEDQQISVDFSLIIEKIKNLFGTDCEVKVDLVNKIEKTSSGKYRYTISEINN